MTFDPAASSTAELTAIALSVMLLLDELDVDPPVALLLAVEFGTRTMDVEVYDFGREKITAAGIAAPIRTKAASNQRRRRKSHNTRPVSNACSDM